MKEESSKSKIIFITAIICVVLCIPIGMVIGMQFINKDASIDENKTPAVDNNTTTDNENNTTNDNVNNTDEENKNHIVEEIDCGTDCIKYTDLVDNKINVMHFVNQTDSIQVYVRNEIGKEDSTTFKVVYNNKRAIEKTIMYTSEVQISKLGKYHVVKYNNAMSQCDQDVLLVFDENGVVADFVEAKVPKETFGNDSISPNISITVESNQIIVEYSGCGVCTGTGVSGHKYTFNTDLDLVKTEDLYCPNN